MRNSLWLERVGSVSLFFVFVLVLALGLSPKSALAQSTSTGTIIGSVVDNSNAVVPDASVTATLKSTGAARTTTTDGAGRYVFADVDPGVYDISVSKTGFSTAVISTQTVTIGLQLTVNAKLQVGAVSTTVTVTETPGSELQTLTPTVGSTLSGAVILNLPNTSRDASTLAVLQPGQNINGATGGEITDQNSFELDGGYATDDMSGDNNTYIKGFGSDTAGGAGAMHSAGITQAPSAVVPIPVASISEFKVSTSNQTADFNGGAGSQMQIETKRGTNTLHGSVYEYYLDNNFAGANTWDNNSTGTAQPSSHFSRFGASAGSKIPRINFLGGSWYLFGNYEGFRYPQAEEFERSFPLPSLAAGIIHLPNSSGGVDTYNLNPFPVVDPGCGSSIKSDCLITTTGQTIAPSMCPAGPCDPRQLGTTTNGVAGGPLNPVIALWHTYLPAPNDCSQGDGLNFCGYKGSISTPQSSNFGVLRLDHDFAQNWHLNATYHYYNLSNTVSDQWDIGGFFPGDVKGQYSAVRQKPQVPWLYTAGLTTNVSSNVTNDFHFSFTRNWWAYGDPGGVPNVAGYPAAFEIGGENSGADTLNAPIFGPYNTDNGDVRTRYWNGHDSMYRDDVTWIKGNHLFQLGGLYQHNNDTHSRNDNGGTINTFEQYLIGTGFPNDLSSLNMNFNGYIPSTLNSGYDSNYENLYSEVLGMVDQSQSLYTRSPGSLETGLPLNTRTSCAIPGIAATSGCIASPPLTNDSIIPTYNGYFTDSWHIKPTFSFNYGLGYTVEMPPFNVNGGYQSVMVDQSDHLIYGEQYLNSVKQAALEGQAYSPLLGFTIVDDVQDHSHYPYDPFYGGLSPRAGFAWNIRPDTVVRAGYARIYGRINGVDPILVPMLTPGLMQPASCSGPNNNGANGGCGTPGNPTTPLNGFRVGVDGVNAPLPPPSANLPQPWYPGFNDVATGAGETIDPNFRPDRSDEFTLSVQHQFGPKILAEVGYIGRVIGNMGQYYSLTAVPYMMTEGGQSFANAWKNVMVATNYGTNLANIPTQPFFEAAMGGPSSQYCSGALAGGIAGAPNCTAEFVEQSSANGLMQRSDPFDSWSAASSQGAFVFGRTFTSDPIAATCTATVQTGCGGQSPSIITTISNGYGNYNAGYLQLTTTNWHGLTMKSNFQYSSALGTGNVVQATGSFATDDPWNLQNAYGPQSYNERFVFNLFFNYAPPYYTSQRGILGHLLGGWSFAPNFVAGSGFPIQIGTGNFDCGSFGECNTNYIASQENGVITQNWNYSASEKRTAGTQCGFVGAGYNVFSNPDATCPVNGGIFGDPVRSPILGLDGQIGGAGPVTGLPFWNLDLGVTKNIKIKERLSSSLYFDWTNVLNHMQPNDPTLNIFSPATWGVLGGGANLQGNTPRNLQLGLSLDW